MKTTRTKKTTVITTETHEQWIIRQSKREPKEQQIDAESDESSANSVQRLRDEISESEKSPEEGD